MASVAGSGEGIIGVVGDMLSFEGGAGNRVSVCVGGGDGGGGVVGDDEEDTGLLSVSKILCMASSGCRWPRSLCV